jgi:hypothetical protein
MVVLLVIDILVNSLAFWLTTNHRSHFLLSMPIVVDVVRSRISSHNFLCSFKAVMNPLLATFLLLGSLAAAASGMHPVSRRLEDDRPSHQQEFDVVEAVPDLESMERRLKRIMRSCKSKRPRRRGKG